MKRAKVWILGLLSLAWTAQSQATLISYGYFTRDTATGLDWLDVNLTSGLSYNAVANGAGEYAADGWRYATGSEIDALALHYIASPEQTYSGGLDFVQTLTVIGLLGPTFRRPLALDNPATLAVLGYYQDGNAASDVGLAEFAVNFLVPSPAFGAPFVGRWATFDDFLGSGTAAPQIGSFLVRTAVPEPSTLMLLLLALAADITVKRKRWLANPPQDESAGVNTASGAVTAASRRSANPQKGRSAAPLTHRPLPRYVSCSVRRCVPSTLSTTSRAAQCQRE